MDEEEAIRRVLSTDTRYDDLLLFCEVVNNTGMRAMEFLGLKVDGVDFERAEIRLSPERTREAKSKVIPLNSAALALLKQARDERDGERFFESVRYGQIDHLWREVCKKAEVVDLHIHDLRHTFASRLLERGERETDINNILGHSKLRMTTRSCTRLRRAGGAL